MVRRAGRVAGGLVVLVTVLLIMRGLRVASYEPVTSDAYAWGAFHVHSDRSDGLGSLEDIARQARDARVSFLMMAEHGAPHESAVESDTIDGVRFIGGSEVGLPEGRLIVSDAAWLPRYTLPNFPPDAVDDVRRWGGMAVVAYPEDPRYRWDYWEDDLVADGIEVINLTSYLRAASVWQVLRWATFTAFNRHYYVNSLESPEYALQRWDELLTRGDVVGFYASNAHGGFRVGDRLDIPIPSYRTVLGLVGLGVDLRYRDHPETAIRAGDFFSVVRAAGEPDRFDFSQAADGRLQVSMQAGPVLSHRLVLKRDGQIIDETREDILVHRPAPGVYRVEVYLEAHPLLAADVPWILSNPIRVGRVRPAPRWDEPPCPNRTALALDEFRVETDDSSTASVQVGPSGAHTLSYHLSQASPREPERWVALALRQPLDLSGTTGVYVDATAADPMRYRLEVRSATTSSYASVLVDEAGRVTVPWRKFYPSPEASHPMRLEAIDALFIQVTDATARTGFDATLRLEGIGLCR